MVLLSLTPPVNAQGANVDELKAVGRDSKKTGDLDSHILDVVNQFETRSIQAHEMRRSGDLQNAIDLFKKNHELVKTTFGDKDLLVAVASDDLAFALLTGGFESEAVRYRETAFEICKPLAQELESRWSELSCEGRSSEKEPDTNYSGLRAQIGRVGGLNRMVSLLTQGLVYSLNGRFSKIDFDSTDTAWRLSAHILDDPPTDSKCYLLNIISLRYWPTELNRSRICLEKLIEIAPKAQDKSILQNAIRRLAKVCLAQADYLSTVKYATAALAIDKRFEEKAISVAQQEDVLILAKAASGLRLYDDARKRYEQLLSMYDELHPSPEAQLEAFEEWSGLLMSLGDFAQAYEGFSICKERSKTLYGADSVQYAFNCQFHGWAAFKLNKFDEAERELNSALDNKTKCGVKNNDTFSMLSRFYSARGDEERARDYLRQSIAAAVDYLNRINDLPLAEQIALLNDQSQTLLDQLLSACETAGDAGAIHSADSASKGGVSKGSVRKGAANTDLYEQILSCRGLLIDSLGARAKTSRLAKDDEVYKTLTREVQLNRNKLVALRSASALREGPDVLEQLELLAASERKLLEHMNAKYGKFSQVVCSPAALKAQLAEGECLIDTYKFSDLKDGKTKYGAFIVRWDGDQQFVEVGESDELERCLNDWIRAIRLNQKYNTVAKRFEAGVHVGEDETVNGGEVLRTTRSVVSLPVANGISQSETQLRLQFIKAMEPIAESLTDADSKLIICCDGEFVRVPWSLVFNGKYLVAEVDNPKQLLERTSTRGVDRSNASLLLVGDVDFSSSRLPNLSGSKAEVDRIFGTASKSIATPPTVLTQLDANKKNILDSMTKSSFVHLATHGLFLSPLGDRVDAGSPQAVGWVFSQRSPLLESAIYVASAGKSELSDAEISADEILKLDLTKNQHVALSACETGLGESFRGQGVLGLRTAFAAAGTQTILMSLWPVDDVATGELMAEYYRQMFDEKLKPAAALAAAQKLIEKRWKNPYYWAGWVLVGNAW